ncbi:MAG: insulinase family protein, partial [Bacteroidota bacterium]
VREVVGPDADWVMIGYRFPARNSREHNLLRLCDMILSNNQAGIIDINLKQQQLVLEPLSYTNGMADYSIHLFTARPRAGQQLEEVRAMLLAQVDSLKAGKFEDWLIDAVVNDLKKSQLNAAQYNGSRVNDMTTAFTMGIPWNEQTASLDQMAEFTREDIIRFARANYQDNHVTIYKRNGTPPRSAKIPKPAITAVELNKESISPLHDSIRTATVEPIKPQFLDFDRDIQRSSMNGGLQVISTPNTENELYTLRYVTEAGSGTDPRISLAFNYLQYLGTSQHPAEWYKREFYRLGFSFGVYGGTDQTIVYVSGLSDNMEQGLKLFEDLIADPTPDPKALNLLIEGVLKQREDTKKDKASILWGGLIEYGLYGPSSPGSNVLTNDQLRALRPEELTEIIRGLNKVRHRVEYYGPMPPSQLTTVLNHTHRLPEKLSAPASPRSFTMTDVVEPAVYWADYDMVQSEIVFVSPGTVFDPVREPEAQLFNEYFGGNMSSPVFQEMRERRALAYSAYAGYSTAGEKLKRDYLFAYVGTQADKQSEAMTAMMGLMNDFPRSEAGFEVARNSLLNRMASTRQVRQGILGAWNSMNRMGIDHDIRKDIYDGVRHLTLDDMANFHLRLVSGKKFNVLVLGNKERIDFKSLARYGKIKQVGLDELFGFQRAAGVKPASNR